MTFAATEGYPMMRIPVATYRLQFTPDFGFDAAMAIAPGRVSDVDTDIDKILTTL